MINEYQRLPLQLVNVGIGGNVVSTKSPVYPHSGKPAADERLDKHVIAHAPDLLIIAYGVNDSRGGTPLELFAQALRDVVGTIRASIQPVIVLLGPYFMTKFEEYGEVWAHSSVEALRDINRITHDVAQQTHTLFVDLLESYGGASWLVHPDGVHAHDVSHRVVANAIFNVLAAHCSGISQETLESAASIPPWRDETMLQKDYGY
jgi:lysophospholipase L1-like esterase